MQTSPAVSSAAAVPFPGYVHSITRAERATVKRWKIAAAPFGIADASFLMLNSPSDDPGQPPCLDVWAIEGEEPSYVLGAPLSPDTADWSVTFVSPSGAWLDWGRFPSLSAALNKVRPCLAVAG